MWSFIFVIPHQCARQILGNFLPSLNISGQEVLSSDMWHGFENILLWIFVYQHIGFSGSFLKSQVLIYRVILGNWHFLCSYYSVSKNITWKLFLISFHFDISINKSLARFGNLSIFKEFWCSNHEYYAKCIEN